MIIAAGSASDERIMRLFLAIAVIVVVARLAGWLFARMRQPPVIGELIAGILLGPTALGALPGDLSVALFPEDIVPLLAVVANLGLVMFMFLTGLELELGTLRRRSRSAVTISLASVGLPFALGILLAAVLYPGHDTGHDGAGFVAFALFIATAVSVTAFPVLARILSDAGIRGTQLGSLVLACAAVEDVIAWTMLALALAVAAAQSLWDVPQIVGASVLFAAGMMLLVRPLLTRVLTSRRSGRISDPALLALAVCGTVLSSYVTGAIGVHLVLGAVLFGITFPRLPALRDRLQRGLGPVALSVLLPVFFALPGLSINLRESLDGGIGELALIFAVACAGKLVGATGAARALGIAWREATAIGALINTRGLMELVVLNVGHSAGIIDDHLYGLFVLMAIATTLMAGPVLNVLYPRGEFPRQIPRARVRRPALGGVLPRDPVPVDAGAE
jgi:Kef-type K+ transport system membrane component KefB